MTADVRRQVRRLLAAKRDVDGVEVAAFPAFRLFREEEPPSWWRKELPKKEWGEVLGVYENRAGTGARAVVVTGEGLAIFDDEGMLRNWLVYGVVDRWDRLHKEPVSTSLVVWRKDGTSVELPLEARSGDAFSFVQFLGSAMMEHRRADRA